MILDFTLIMFFLFLAYHTFNLSLWIKYIILFFLCIFYANRLNALGILMHDAVHSTFHRNKKVNEFFGVFISFFLLMSYYDFRTRHIQHHFENLSEQDHDKKVIIFLSQLKLPFFLKLIFSPIIAFIYQKEIKKIYQTKNIPIKYIMTIISIQIIILTILFYIKWELIIFYVFSLYLAYIFSIIRVTLEHSYNETKKTWNFLHDNILLNCTIYAHGIGFHSLHHLFPTIPWYNLKKTHLYLINNHEKYRDILKIKGKLTIFFSVFKIIKSNISSQLPRS